jgi:hypothetical protein
MSKKSLCVCGSKPKGACRHCGKGLCKNHVATFDPGVVMVPKYNEAQLARRSFEGHPLRERCAVVDVRDSLNQTWLCSSCLRLAEDAGIAALAAYPQPPLLLDTTDLMARYRHLADSDGMLSLYFSRAEWVEAAEAMLAHAGGATSICRRAARKVWNSRAHITLRGKGGFLRAGARLEVAVAGEQVDSTRLPWTSEWIQAGDRIATDGDDWYRVIDHPTADERDRDPWSMMEPDLELAWVVALPVLDDAEYLHASNWYRELFLKAPPGFHHATTHRPWDGSMIWVPDACLAAAESAVASSL